MKYKISNLQLLQLLQEEEMEHTTPLHSAKEQDTDMLMEVDQEGHPHLQLSVIQEEDNTHLTPLHPTKPFFNPKQDENKENVQNLVNQMKIMGVQTRNGKKRKLLEI